MVFSVVVAAVVLLIGGCSVLGSGGGPIAVSGEWTLVGDDWDGDGNDNVERWTIADGEIHYESSLDGTDFSTTYRADIVSYSNYGLNAGDTSLTADGPEAENAGFAVIEFTEVDGPGTGEVGKYNVFRWAENAEDPNARDFTQGYKDVDPEDAENNANDVFDTAAAAEAGASNENGYFSFASRGVTKEE